MSDTSSPAPSLTRAVVGLGIGLIASVFFAGVAAGFLEEAAKDGGALVSPRFGAAVTGLTVAAITLYLFVPSLPKWKGMSPRRRLYWGSLGISGLAGGVIGALIQIDSHRMGADASGLIGNGALSADFAIAVSAIWLVTMAVACTVYHRAIDDHEERAWLWAGLAGWYAFVIPTPVWWVLHRADMAPPVDAMIMFIVAMVANGIVWTWLKFR